MSTRTIVFVGATSGIGRHAAQRLATAGHRLVLIGRDPQRVHDLRAALPNATVIAADVATKSGIDTAAVQIAESVDRVDTLVNNAGVMLQRRTVTAEGIEQNLAVHHLAPYSMTSALLPLLRRGGGRVVNVNSEGHRSALLRSDPIDIDFDDLGSAHDYHVFVAYSRSKLAGLLFSYELQRRHPELEVVAVHPGMIRSDLVRGFSGLRLAAVRAASLVLSMPTARGADPIVHLATEPEVRRGAYYNRFAPQTSSPASRDLGTARRLWEITEQLRGTFSPADPPGGRS
ncbi:SDR family NAD(P)-dependent oxidoreductase [Nocardia nepalensis]|uniref:SDR family NAD(P)-dependent oxidoreductase n=1 Tax=Nocardia nepalensis TaxID=3375448 RepID=UPI003B67738E